MCSREFKDVIYIMGNHEHYNHDFKTTHFYMGGAFADLRNIHFLDKSVKVIDDVLFFGGTLWTDMNKEDPITLETIKYMMNDFRCVSNGTNGGYSMMPFTPQDAVKDHKEFLEILEKVLVDNATMFQPDNNYEKVVVVGHHAPSHLSISHNFKNDKIGNGGYQSDLSGFILDHPEIKLWTHGHSHDPFDYMIGGTRVYSNPRGYFNHEFRASQFKLETVEV